VGKAEICNTIVSQFTELRSTKFHTELEMLTQQIGSQGVDLSTYLSNWLSSSTRQTAPGTPAACQSLSMTAVK